MTDQEFYHIRVRIGLNIMYQRRQCRLTQLQLAERIGCSRHQLQRVETARCTPSLSMLLRLSNALNIPLAKLLEP